MSPTSTAPGEQQGVGTISRRTNEVLSKTNEQSPKSKMNENPLNGTR